MVLQLVVVILHLFFGMTVFYIQDTVIIVGRFQKVKPTSFRLEWKTYDFQKPVSRNWLSLFFWRQYLSKVVTTSLSIAPIYIIAITPLIILSTSLFLIVSWLIGELSWSKAVGGYRCKGWMIRRCNFVVGDMMDIW